MDRLGIYVVDVPNRFPLSTSPTVTRLVITAPSAARATELALMATVAEGQRKAVEPHVSTGRIGDFDPGITGAQMASQAIVAMQP